MPEPTQVAIVGGGPLGLALAVALTQQGRDVRLFDARKAGEPHKDARVLALSYGSKQLLGQLGAWPEYAATPIESIHISQRGALGRTRLHSNDYGISALGYVAPASALVQALQKRAEALGVKTEFDTRVVGLRANGDGIVLDVADASGNQRSAAAQLAACCEGSIAQAKDSDTVVRDYEQIALLLRATPEGGHHNIAYERFTPDGPIALLPLGTEYAVVWTVSPAQLRELMALDDAGMLAALQQAFGKRVQFSAVRDRASFPLSLRYRKQPVVDRAVWLGNAAQTLHPVAGQGFNLALRDAIELADALREATDLGAASVLGQYERGRRTDRVGAIGFTDALVRLFSNDNALLTHARGAGLFALDVLPPLRHFVTKRMIFGARAWP